MRELNRLAEELLGMLQCVRHVVGKGAYPPVPADQLELEARAVTCLEAFEGAHLIGQWETIREWRELQGEGSDVDQTTLGELLDAGVLTPPEKLFPGCTVSTFAPRLASQQH